MIFLSNSFIEILASLGRNLGVNDGIVSFDLLVNRLLASNCSRFVAGLLYMTENELSLEIFESIELCLYFCLSASSIVLDLGLNNWRELFEDCDKLNTLEFFTLIYEFWFYFEFSGDEY